MKLLSVVGARPQFVKVGPVARFIAQDSTSMIEHLIVHTGQHYDPMMSDVFFKELSIPEPDYNLEVGSGTQGKQTAAMLEKLEAVFFELKPDVVIVYGDTNSTLAAALAAVKLHIPVSHVEAGLRSFNRAMPEEINRIVADHTADQLLAPTKTAMQNLEQENLEAKSLLTGDVMRDAILFYRELASEKSKVLDLLKVRAAEYAIVTIHRAESTDGPALVEILKSLNEIAERYLPLIFPMHPRTRARITELDWQPHARLHLIEPVGYLDMVCLVDNAKLVLTDSGGLQKEALFLNTPCVTLRDETEWLETVEAQANRIVGHSRERICAAAEYWLTHEIDSFDSLASKYFGSGDAAKNIVNAVTELAA